MFSTDDSPFTSHSWRFDCEGMMPGKRESKDRIRGLDGSRTPEAWKEYSPG